MLTFSRNAARRSRDGQVRRAIETASAILRYGMSRSAIELHVDMPDDVPAVACSQSDLEQVFLNLLTNAREATPHGGRIAVSIRSADRVVSIAIADTGCGIPRENLPRVLEPFFTTKPHGNGLGSVDLPLGPVGSRRHVSRFRASPAAARTSTLWSRRRYRSRTHWGHETGAHPGRGRRARHASRGRPRVLSRPSRGRNPSLARCVVNRRRVPSRAGHRRHPDAGSGRLRADGATEGALSRIWKSS